MVSAKVQPLPIEIQALIDAQQAAIAQCDGELASLQKAVDNWQAQKQAALNGIKALKFKYGKPGLTVWPPEVTL